MSRTDANALAGRVLAEVPPFLLVGLGGLLRVSGGPLWAASLLVGGGVLWQVLALARIGGAGDADGARINNLGRLAVIGLLLLLGNWGAFTGGLALLALFLGVCVALRCGRYPDGPQPVRRREFNPLRGV
ncbi:hypothetical protein [Actinomyces sp. 565]|uniref:hypothetical protein n=1 Tax=Actinomyces sp. 565 TaxID=2057794 RepID=UPI0013A6CE4E|nr:hypothetical protein [Actinomyces sp. 565]NDR53385.1 hypothetical protein [Actinomyces sp. 565]